jgi:cell division protein FtsB
LKPAVNSSFTKFNYGQVATVRAAWWALRIPNYVWLAMIITAAAALALNTIAREREEVRRAQTALAQTQGRAAQTQTVNQRLKDEIKGLKNDPRAIGRAAHERLNYVHQNEIVIATQ